MKIQKYYIFTFLILALYCSAQEKIESTNSTSSVTDIDRNVYKTVKIGNQLWMAENLKVTRYRNGDAIPNRADDEEWDNSTGAYCNYNNDTTNSGIFGKLYNWFAIDDSRKISPVGWHVPSDVKWQELIDYLGGDTLAGGKMKSPGTIEGGDGLWNELNENSTNESGFSAVPGGYRYSHGVFGGTGSTTYFWSTTESSNGTAWHRHLYSTNSIVYRYDDGWKQAGYSVRCVKN